MLLLATGEYAVTHQIRQIVQSIPWKMRLRDNNKKNSQSIIIKAKRQNDRQTHLICIAVFDVRGGEWRSTNTGGKRGSTHCRQRTVSVVGGMGAVQRGQWGGDILTKLLCACEIRGSYRRCKRMVLVDVWGRGGSSAWMWSV